MYHQGTKSNKVNDELELSNEVTVNNHIIPKSTGTNKDSRIIHFD